MALLKTMALLKLSQMKIQIHVGDVLDQAADVLISTANPWLNLSGGVNGAIRERCGDSIQQELHEHLKALGQSSLPAGTVVRSSSGSLPFQHIVHAVAIDPFYDSSIALVQQTLVSALELAHSLNARSVAMPTLATGYGPLSVAAFGQALILATTELQVNIDTLTVVVQTEENAQILRNQRANE